LVINSAKLMTSTEAMLLDSGYIQELEAEWRNRKAERRGKKPYPHLYTAADAISCLQSFQSVSYGEDVQLDEQVRVRFLEYSLISRIFLVTVIRRTKGRQMCRGRCREDARGQYSPGYNNKTSAGGDAGKCTGTYSLLESLRNKRTRRAPPPAEPHII
jgi:hypothetical protein